MSWIDYTVIGLISLSTIVSFFRGFTREAISLVFWIAALLIALRFSTALQPYLQDYLLSDSMRYGVAFVGLFLLVFVFGALVNYLVHLLVDKAGLSMTDRMMGIFFGAARGWVVAAVMLMFFNVGALSQKESLQESKLMPYFQPIVAWLQDFLPERTNAVSDWVKQQGKAHPKNPPIEIDTQEMSDVTSL